METFQSESGSLVPGDDVSANLQTEQPALTLLLPVCHRSAELGADYAESAEEGEMVAVTHGEPSRPESSLPAGTLWNVAGCTLVQGEDTGPFHDIDAL